MKMRLLCIGFLFVAVFGVTAAVDDSMQVRRFVVCGSICSGFAEKNDDDILDIFSAMGVTWPKGSYIKYVNALNILVVRNTKENIDAVERILLDAEMIPFQVEIRLDYIEYDMKDIEILAKNGRLSTKPLQKLWREGKAKLLFSPSVVTQSGQQATVKSVDEYIYPTEFTVIEVQSGEGKGQENNQRPAEAQPPAPTPTPQAVEPGSFETREVGVILDVLPEVARGGRLVNITISPETVAPPRWKDYGQKLKQKDGSILNLPMEQPIFSSRTLQSNILVAPGATVMIGGGLNNIREEKTVFVFLTTRLIGIDGLEIKISQ